MPSLSKVADYCGLIGKDPVECGESVAAAGEKREGVGEKKSWFRQVITHRSFRKGFDKFEYDQVGNVPIPYRDPGCPSAEGLAEGERLLGIARIAVGQARHAYGLARAAHVVASMGDRPATFKGEWRADHHYPGVPTDDPRARHVWAAYQATERLIGCVRQIPDPIFREDLVRIPLVEALVRLKPATVLSAPRDASVKALAAAIENLELVTGHLAMFVHSMEQNIVGMPLQRAFETARKGVFLLAAVLAARAAWRWVT